METKHQYSLELSLKIIYFRERGELIYLLGSALCIEKFSY